MTAAWKFDFLHFKFRLFYSSNPEYVISRTEMYIGQLVAAMYTDNLWYRARIVGCHEDFFQVFYVDYGSKNFVKPDRIRHLHLHFLKMPLQVTFYFKNGSFVLH